MTQILDIDDIISNYKMGKNIYFLAKKYNVTYKVIKRIVLKNNLELFDGRSHSFAENEIKEIVSLYKNGMSIVLLRKKYKCSDNKIKIILKRNKIKCRGLKEARKYRKYYSYVDNEQVLFSVMINDYLKNNFSILSLSRKYNLSVYLCKRVLQKHNIEIRPPNCGLYTKRKHKLSDENRETLKFLYINKRSSIRGLSRKYGLTVSAIKKFLLSSGIKLHTNSCNWEQNHPGMGFQIKYYTLPSGNQIKLQGYEPQFMDYVLKNNIYKEEDFDFKRRIIKYEYKGEEHNYFPDFYIPKKNLIVEIKSEYILNKQGKDVCRAKEEATRKLGYDYLMILDNNYEKVSEKH